MPFYMAMIITPEQQTNEVYFFTLKIGLNLAVSRPFKVSKYMALYP